MSATDRDKISVQKFSQGENERSVSHSAGQGGSYAAWAQGVTSGFSQGTKTVQEHEVLNKYAIQNYHQNYFFYVNDFK